MIDALHLHKNTWCLPWGVCSCLWPDWRAVFRQLSKDENMSPSCCCGRCCCSLSCAWNLTAQTSVLSIFILCRRPWLELFCPCSSGWMPLVGTVRPSGHLFCISIYASSFSSLNSFLPISYAPPPSPLVSHWGRYHPPPFNFHLVLGIGSNRYHIFVQKIRKPLPVNRELSVTFQYPLYSLFYMLCKTARRWHGFSFGKLARVCPPLWPEGQLQTPCDRQHVFMCRCRASIMHVYLVLLWYDPSLSFYTWFCVE
jgi:hypothetical protein